MKKYTVEIEFYNKRKNQLVVWADDGEEATRIAVKWWGNPGRYKNITATEENYHLA